LGGTVCPRERFLQFKQREKQLLKVVIIVNLPLYKQYNTKKSFKRGRSSSPKMAVNAAVIKANLAPFLPPS
jgi:hypothetical protein